MNSNRYILSLMLAGAVMAQAPPDLREAARLDQAGRCGESEKIYQRALAQGAPGPALLNNTGNHYLACGKPDQARAYFEKLLKAVPNQPNALLQLARLEMAARAFSRAEELLGKLAPTRPGDFDVLLLLGQAAGRAGHATRARDTLEAALRLRPDDPAAMLEAGLANAASGDYPRAVFLLARAHQQAPKHPGIALALARASEDAGYYGDAVIAYDRYLALTPDDVTTRRDRARAQAQTIAGRDQGVQQLADYVEKNPRDPLGHFYLAQVIWSGDEGGALMRLDKAVKLDSRLAPAHVARAWLLHRMGRDEEALPHLEAALRITPNESRAWDQLGVVLLSLDRLKEAETALRKAVELAPQSAEAALHLGRALMDQGQEQEGRQWLDKYQKLRPARQRDARREPGMIDLATLDPAGRRAREIERFRSMARARPDDPLLQLHLAGLLLADGQTEEALREYRLLAERNADAAIWTQAGRALLDAGEHEAAKTFLARAGLPEDPSATALHLATQARYQEALKVLARATASTPAGAELSLTEAIVLALSGNTQSALDRLRRIESRYPEWDRPWLVHGILLREAKRPAEAAAKFRNAAALGMREDAAACATLREWVSGACRK